MPGNEEKIIGYRDAILEVLKQRDAETWDAARALACALNELLAPRGEQAVITLRPLLTYHEVENKI